MTRLTKLLRAYSLFAVSIGSNDFFHRQPESETRAIIQACKTAGAEIILVGVPGVGAALGDHALYADIAKTENIPYYANGWSQILGKESLKSDQSTPTSPATKL